MPIYQDLYCEGACERLGRKCIRPDMFVLVASEYGAVPKAITGETKYLDDTGDPQVTQWKYHALDVQGDDRGRALHETAAKMHKDLPDHIDIGEFLIVVEQAFLQEFPCHLECDITICGHCGQQHEKRYISKDGCELMPEGMWPEP